MVGPGGEVRVSLSHPLWQPLQQLHLVSATEGRSLTWVWLDPGLGSDMVTPQSLPLPGLPVRDQNLPAGFMEKGRSKGKGYCIFFVISDYPRHPRPAPNHSQNQVAWAPLSPVSFPHCQPYLQLLL